MLGFLFRRLGDIIPTFFGVTLLVFFLIRLIPSDPILMMAGERGVDAERYAELQAQYGFDQPLIVQYFDYLMGVFQGDLGKSFVTKKPVLDEFLVLFPATVELGLTGILFAVCLGVPALVREGMSWTDVRLRTLSAAPVRLAPRQRSRAEDTRPAQEHAGVIA